MAFDFPASPTQGQQFSPSAGTTYVYNGYAWDLLSGPASTIPVTVPKITTITASQTWTPSAGLVAAIVEVVGGGGGGAGIIGAAGVSIGGGGGGSGGYSRRLLTAAQIGASQTVTIGAGTANAGGNVAGANGGDTSFGSLVIAKGGLGGQPGSGNYLGGAGGTITGAVGDIVGRGIPGMFGGSMIWGQGSQTGGEGGSSVFGGGAGSVFINASAGSDGLNASNYGGGGSGAEVSNVAAGQAGGAGSDGVCIVTEFIQQGGAAAAALPGSKVLIQTQTVSAAVASVDFKTGIDATYDEYEIVYFGATFSASGNVGLRVSSDGGSTWKAGASDYAYSNVFINSSGAFSGGSGDAMYMFNVTASSNTSSGVIKFFEPYNTTRGKHFLWDVHYAAALFSRVSGTGLYAAVQAAAFNGVRLLSASGNINSGTFNLYGIKK